MPPAIALGMLDKDLAVYKVTLVQNKEVRYDDGRRAEEAAASRAWSARRIRSFSRAIRICCPARRCASAGFATHLADSRRGLAAALQIPLALADAGPDARGRLAGRCGSM